MEKVRRQNQHAVNKSFQRRDESNKMQNVLLLAKGVMGMKRAFANVWRGKEIRGEVYPLLNERVSVLFMAANISAAKVGHFYFYLPVVANLRILDSKEVIKT